MAIRVSFLCAFYPEHQWAANSSTGLALLLEDATEVGSVEIFAQEGARIPPCSKTEKLRVNESWRVDNPLTLIRACIRLISARNSTDAYLVNTYVTAFGTSRICNAVGLFIPAIVSRITSKRVIVIMHNFVETQDLELLGYRHSNISRIAASLLERLLVRSTIVAVPLESQWKRISDSFSASIRWLPLPFIETLAQASQDYQPPTRPPPTSKLTPVRVLLFGTWGPQKDLGGILRDLDILSQRGFQMRVVVAGGANRHFPGAGEELRQLKETYSSDRVRFEGEVLESAIPALLRDTDVVVLPYNTSGGYSATLNWAAAFQLPVISYDLPQLREHAAQLGADVRFVQKGDTHDIGEAFESIRQYRHPLDVESDSKRRNQLDTLRVNLVRLLGVE